MKRHMTRQLLLVVGVLVGLVLALSPAYATHIPAALDIPILRPPMPGEGYLNFVEVGPGGPCPAVPFAAPAGPCTEEYTGWTEFPVTSTGDTNDFPTDNGLTHGDRADFDWVVENRAVELGALPFPLVNHPVLVGFMLWEIAPTTPSAHINPFTGLPHAHVPLLPVCPDGSMNLCDPDYTGTTFRVADVFSVISLEANPDEFGRPIPPGPFNPLVTDTEAIPREARWTTTCSFVALS